MPKPIAKPLTWSRILDGAERLDAQYGTTRYGNAVVAKMLARVVERLPPPPGPRAVFSRKLFSPRPPVLSPAQQRMADRRRKAYD
jgi:hypothetical protein